MSDSTIQVLEGLFGPNETVEDADSGVVLDARGIAPTDSPTVQPVMPPGALGRAGLLPTLGLAALAYYLFFRR